MQIERVQTDAVETPTRLRAIDPVRVKALADSMGAIGLRQPITVWSQAGDQLDLVAGAHRLEAARLLNWDWIDAIFLDGSDIDRQLWEIDENLMRSELTATQQAEHLAKRKELWAMRNTGADCASIQGRGQPKQFAADTSVATGVSKATVNRATSRAEHICADARDIVRGTRLDTGIFLDKLKAVAPEFQTAFVKEHLEKMEKPKPRRAADPENDLEVKEKQVAALMAAWNRAGKDAREEFMTRVDQPIMEAYV